MTFPSAPPGHHDEAVRIPASRLAELARRIERAGADARLCKADEFRAPGYSAARVRDALLGSLGMLTDRSHNYLHGRLREGKLVEEYSAAEVRTRTATCAICHKTRTCIDAKHNPKETDVFQVCRSEQDCTGIVG